jgi:hypothetical protein
MGGSYTVALVGFAQNESSTFESFFRLAARRPPGYLVQDEVMDAQILIVNADNTQALHLVRYAELPGKVLLLGNSDGGTGWPLQRKPVKLVSVLAALDAIVGVSPAAPARKPAAASAKFAATQPFQASQTQGLDASMRRASGQLAAAEPALKRSRAGEDRNFPATQPFSESVPAPMVPAVTGRRKAAESEFPPTRPMTRSSAAGAPAPKRLTVGDAPAAPAPAQAPVRRVGAPMVPAVSGRSARPGVMRLTDFGGLDELPAPPSAPAPSRSSKNSRSPRSQLSASKAPVPEVQRGDVLLVAESLVEGRILHKRFKRYGLSIDWSREAAQALVMLKAHPTGWWSSTGSTANPMPTRCAATPNSASWPNGQSPVVIMFAPTAGSMDRMKAGLAGSDAYLSRSVGEADLYKVLAQHRLVSLDGFEKTNIGFDPPRAAPPSSPPRGRHEWPGKAGSTASWVNSFRSEMLSPQDARWNRLCRPTAAPWGVTRP